MVTREAEWDDTERAKMAAYTAYERGVGPCGHHHAETRDPSEFFFDIAEARCPVCAALDVDARVQKDADEKWLKQFGEDGPSATTPHPDDGRIRFASRVPKDEALERIRQAREGVDRGNTH